MLDRFAKLGAVVGLCACATLVTGDALATGTRLDSMGGGAKYWTVEDEANIFDFPSLLVRYGDMTYVDNINAGVGGAGILGNTRFGFHLGIGDALVLAAYGGRINSDTRGTGNGFSVAGNAFTGTSSLAVGEQANLASPLLGSGPRGIVMNNFNIYNANGAGAGAVPGTAGFPGGPPRGTNVDLKVGLLAAINIGETMRLGLMINALGDDGDTEQAPGLEPLLGEQDKGAFLMDIALGFGLDLVNAELEIALGIEFGILEDYRDQTSPADPNQLIEQQQNWTVDQFGIRLNARFRYDFDEQYKLITYLGFNYGTQSIDNVAALPSNPQNATWDGIDLRLGADLRMELFEDVFVVPGIGIRWAQISLEGQSGAVVEVSRDIDRLLSLPYYSIGVDIKVLDWLDFRFGASQSIDFIRASVTNVGGTVEQRASDVVTNLATGIGINLPVNESMLSLDININPLFWVNGPDFISGGANNVTQFGVSGAIKYDW